MIAQRPIYHYARLVLEATTPHGVHSGHGDATHDVLLVRDANGLPYIPATSLAGVLRHLYIAEYGDQDAGQVFGHVKGDEGQPSWLNVMAALVNDSRNLAQEGLRDDPQADPILAFLLDDKPLVRQRVKLGMRGTAADTGKFDGTLIPAGTRYTTFIGYWASDADDGTTVFEQLLALLNHPAFRLGHGTRSGSGAFRVQALDTACWDLRIKEERDGYCQRPRKRAQHHGLSAHQPATDNVNTHSVTAVLSLQAEGGLRIGGGEVALSGPDAKGRLPDLLPQSEPRIVWHGDQAKVSEPVPVIPGSAVKGAIAHRLGFHYRRLSGDLLDPAQMPVPDDTPEPGALTLLGWAVNGDEDEGRAGKLLIDDIYLEAPKVLRQTHNRIDRFTGGVMQGALFEQEVLWQPPLTLTLTILDIENLQQDPVLLNALNATLEDLANGALPLGANGSRGQGSLIGTGAIQWSDQGQWLAREATQEATA
ncbi:RAMP superfamily CRISPR-associated protein [Vreelandella aquamarina]